MSALRSVQNRRGKCPRGKYEFAVKISLAVPTRSSAAADGPSGALYQSKSSTAAQL